MGRQMLKYESYIFVGMTLVIATFIKLVFQVKIDSDWFWFIAGLALVIEGFIDLKKEAKFKRKYKIVSKKEFESLWDELETYKKKKKK